MAEPQLYAIGDDAPPKASIAQIRDIVRNGGPALLTDEEYKEWRAHQRDTGAVDWEDHRDHHANLAHRLRGTEDGKRFLRRLAMEVIEQHDQDERSRDEWKKMEIEAIRYLGVSPKVKPSADFEGASDAVHPLFAEACVQFQSRAMRVLWPAGGPAKATPLGEFTEQKWEQARRVERHMNYHFTKVLRNSRRKQAKMLFRLPVSGSFFTKPYYDHINGVVDRAMVEPEFFVVPYKAEGLENAPRYTEVCRLSDNDVRKRQLSGEFIEADLLRPNEEETGEQEVHIEIEQEKKAAEGREQTEYRDNDDRHVTYYTARNLDIPGFEDKDEKGRKTGIELPYLVVTNRDSMKVLHISRLWREDDERKRRLVEYHHYEFVPGLGFYGYGFYHLIGGLIRGSTGALRSLLDAAGFANLKGGLKNSDVKIKGDGKKIGHGVFADAEWSGEGPLKDQLVLMNYGDPSEVLYRLLGDMVEWGRRLMGITETLVGDGTSTVPVGTQLSRVEQGMMVATEIHKSVHATQAQEFERIAELMWIWGDEEYSYDVPGESRSIKRADFDPKIVDIGLVADPEYATNSQRYYISEASIQLAERNPAIYNQEALHRRAQTALGIESVDDIIPKRSSMAKRMGPVEEGAAVLNGLPVKAFLEQDHESHIIVHQAMQGTLGEGQGDLAQVLEAHVREHLALAYLEQMQQMTGHRFPVPNKEEMLAGDYLSADPDVENAVAQAAAEAAMQMQAQQQERPDPDMEKVLRDADREDMKAQRAMARQDGMAEASIQRANLQQQEKAAINEGVAAQTEARRNLEAVAGIEREGVKTAETMLLKRQQAREQQPKLAE